MAKGVRISLKGVRGSIKQFKRSSKEIKKEIDSELTAGAIQVAANAKRRAPVDEGLLRNSIRADVSGPTKRVIVGAFYAAYLEFGTGKKVKIPPGYAEFAAKYKGRANRGNIMQFFYRLVQWVRRKKVSGVYSVKTKRRLGNRATQANQDYEAAYFIMLKILANGIRPQPFMIPAFEEEKPRIIKRVKNIINGHH